MTSFMYGPLKIIFIPPTYSIKGVYWSEQTVGRLGWSVGEMLCLKLFQQFSSHLNETRYT